VKFVARDSPHYVDLVLERLPQSVDRLQEFPESGRVVPERQDPQIREILLGSYRVIYRLREELTEVLTVFPGFCQGFDIRRRGNTHPEQGS
jgi:plasmid stabilization system protein ParE